MPIPPDDLKSIRERVHRHCAEAIPRWNRWVKKPTPTPDETDAPQLLEEIAANRYLPQTFEKQAHWFAVRVIADGWGRRDIPKDFHPEVQRLVNAMRERTL